MSRFSPEAFQVAYRPGIRGWSRKKGGRRLSGRGCHGRGGGWQSEGEECT